MNRLKLSVIALSTALLIIAGTLTLYFKESRFLQTIDAKLIDSAFWYRGAVPADERIVIVDIDERSLQALGQWPWSRNKIARLIQNLSDAGAAIIGLDMVFAEKDNSSPIRIAKEANLSISDLPDYDMILAQTFASTPTIAGFTFDFQKRISNPPPPSSVIYVEHNRGEKNMLLEAEGIITNIPVLQDSAYSSGSFNTVPDSDGIIRYVPLLIAYEDSIYPALSFEMIRALLGEKRVDILYDDNGITQINLGEIEIPVNANGKLFINYRGPQKSYRYLSAVDIYNNSFDKDAVSDKIILLGTSAAGLLDLRATPFESVYPGVEVHANLIDNVINDEMVAASASLDLLLTPLAVLLSVLFIALVMLLAPPLTAFGLIVGWFMAEGAFYYQMLFYKHQLLNMAAPFIATLASLVAFTLLKVYFENRQKEMIHSKFAKKVSPQVAAQLLKSDKDLFSTTQTEITIFFSDIRNFTTISESFDDPKLLIDYLNTYMSPMSRIIIEHQGTIDKYIGDAIMAYWNAPLPLEAHADEAVSAAIEQIEALKSLNQTLQKKELPPIDIGIGIHTGIATVGEMGSEGRSDYTVIGDTINLGSRIEGLCKTYGAKILISQSTRAQLQKRYKIREVDIVQVKGKNRAVTIYEVLGFGAFDGEEADIYKQYMHARRLYKEARFKEAYTLFTQLHRNTPHRLYALYIERCEAYRHKSIKEFDGVHRFTTK
jgi:adenylate cyclase